MGTRAQFFLENIQPNAVSCNSSEENSRKKNVFYKVDQWDVAVKCLMPVIYCLQNLYAFGVQKYTLSWQHQKTVKLCKFLNLICHIV